LREARKYFGYNEFKVSKLSALSALLSSLDFQVNPRAILFSERKTGGVLRGKFFLTGKTNWHN
jgi:hypothetical protein|tara:strand:- start:205 stop:393 length:189 start_codon:yes stop_codon:yes gene_type:complete